jgi:hypothetical protein
MLRYSTGYIIEDGVLLPNPHVKIYNGLDNPVQLAESCLNALIPLLK